MKKLRFIVSIFTIVLIFQACAKEQQQISNESLTLRKVSVFNEKDILLPAKILKLKKTPTSK